MNINQFTETNCSIHELINMNSLFTSNCSKTVILRKSRKVIIYIFYNIKYSLNQIYREFDCDQITESC